MTEILKNMLTKIISKDLFNKINKRFYKLIIFTNNDYQQLLPKVFRAAVFRNCKNLCTLQIYTRMIVWRG